MDSSRKIPIGQIDISTLTGNTVSGITNRISKFTGTTSLGSSISLTELPNGYVGIGTDIPSSPLHVNSSTESVYVRIQGAADGDNYGALELWNNTANSKWQFAHKSIAGQNKDFSFTHYNGTSWRDVMRLTNLFNVVINLTADNTIDRLQVGGSAVATAWKTLSGTSAQYVKGDGTLGTISSLTGGTGGGGTVGGSGTPNIVAKWSSTSGLTNSSISDTGALVTINTATTVNGTFSSSLDASIHGLTVGVLGGAPASTVALGSLLSTTMDVSATANTLIGSEAGSLLTLGGSNTLIGRRAGQKMTTLTEMVAVGVGTLQNLTTGIDNTTVGAWSLGTLTGGSKNVAFGYYTGAKLVSGNNNTFLGRGAGTYIGAGNLGLLTSNDGIFIGMEARALADNSSNEIVIGNGIIGAGSNSVTLGNDAITQTVLKGNVNIGGVSSTSSKLIVTPVVDNTGIEIVMPAGVTGFPDGLLVRMNGTSYAGANFGIPSAVTVLANSNNGAGFLMRFDSGIGNSGFRYLKRPEVNGNFAYNLTLQGTNTSLFNVNDLGHVFGQSFIKAGGLSTEYLMADGSVSTGGGGGSQPVSATGSGIVNNVVLQELGGVDKLINGLRIGRGAGNLDSNTIVGYQAGNSNTTGVNNTALGQLSLQLNSTGNGNTAIGRNALPQSVSASDNTAIGLGALFALTTNGGNTALGNLALGDITSGYYNIGIGHRAGRYLSDGVTPITNATNSIYIGFNSRSLTDTPTNEIVIGSEAAGNGTNTVTIGNDLISKTVLKGNVGIGSSAPDGKLHLVDITPIPQLTVQTNTNRYGIPQFSKNFVRHYASTTGTILTIPFISQGSINTKTMITCDIIDSSNYGDTTYAASFKICVNSLTTVSSLTSLQSLGNIASITVSGSNVLVTFANPYNVDGVNNGITVDMRILTSNKAGSIDYGAITMN